MTQNIVQGSLSIKPTKICHKNNGEVLALGSLYVYGDAIYYHLLLPS